MLAERIPEIQSALVEAELDGWLFAVFQGNDPISTSLLGLTSRGLVTRRCYYLVPSQGEPRRLVHDLEPTMLDHLPGTLARYRTWQEHRQAMEALVRDCRRLAAQYSPRNELPSVSRLDHGTAELLASFGCELITSADLVQRFAAVWTPAQLEGHRRANLHLHRIVREAFTLVAGHLRGEREIDERQVQRFILEAFEGVGLHTEADPIVGVNAHAADPHYEPTDGTSLPIREGDLLLIDLWAKEKTPESVYADITWCGVCAASPTPRQQEIWSVVRDARDAGIELVRSRWPGTPIRGYEVDDAVREVIRRAGYGEQFIHRTGHSIGIQDHGQGANMDNLETHDTRRLIAMTGFSIEPGVYLTGELGVRSEVNIVLTPEAAEVTGGEPQRELLRLLE
ncbi:MAG: aminopeptidase P family protein [Thermoanaerobaculia bacterium]|nr:MAG: aminopeptidase P family protein [Thermoanaerobaculia bacterium]